MKRLGLTLKQRVLLGLTVLVALLLTLAAFSWRDVHQNRETIERMVHLDARKVSLANSVSSRLARVSRELYVLVEEDRPDLLAAFQRSLPERRAAASRELDELATLLYRPEGRALLAQVRQQRARFVESSGQVVALLDAGQAPQARDLFQRQCLPALTAYSDAMDQFLQFQERLFLEGGQRASAQAAQQENLLMALSLTAALLAALVGWWILRSVTRPLGGDPRVASEAMTHIADGNLGRQVPVRAGDQHSLLGRLAGMRVSLHRMVGSIQGAAQDVSLAARDLSTSCQQIAAGAQEQGNSTASMASAVEELAGNIEMLSSASLRVLDVAERSEQLASNSDRLLGEAATEINKSCPAGLAGAVGAGQAVGRLRSNHDGSNRRANAGWHRGAWLHLRQVREPGEVCF